MKTFDSNWLVDTTDKNMRIAFRIDKKIYEGKTKFQKVDIISTKFFGKTLFLDGKVQSAEKDEIIYHESLVHPSMLMHSNPEKVLIIGGGEGATLREVLKYKEVKKCVMVDIDRELIEICKKFMPEWSNSSFNDRRLELIINDGKEYIEACDEKFDVVIMDATDPTEDISLHLFSREFFELLKNKMNKHAIFTSQMGYINYSEMSTNIDIYKRLKNHFEIVGLSQIFVPSFSFPWSLMTASDIHDPRTFTKEEIDKRISNKEIYLKYYDGESHLSMFMISKTLREMFRK